MSRVESRSRGRVAGKLREPPARRFEIARDLRQPLERGVGDEPSMDEEGDLLVDVGKRLRIRAGLEGGPRAADLLPGAEDPFREVAGGETRRLESRPPGRKAALELVPAANLGAAGQAAFEDRPHDELVREPRRRAGRLPVPLPSLRPWRNGHREVTKGESLHPAEGPANGAELLAEPQHREAKEPGPMDHGGPPRPVEEAERDARPPVLEGGVTPEPDPCIDRIDVVREVPEAPGGDSGALERPLRGPGEAPGRLDLEPALELVEVAAAPEHLPARPDDLETHVEVGGQELETKLGGVHLDPRDLAERGRERIDDPGRREARPREAAPGGVAERNDPPADRAGQRPQERDRLLLAAPGHEPFERRGLKGAEDGPARSGR